MMIEALEKRESKIRRWEQNPGSSNHKSVALITEPLDPVISPSLSLSVPVYTELHYIPLIKWTH